MTDRSAADEELMKLATQDVSDDAPDAGSEANEEPLELGGEDAPEATPDDIAADEEKKKTRSHSLTNRVHALTARLRAAEQEAAELRARSAPAAAGDDPEPDPRARNQDGTDKYEFGEADPQFVRDYASYAARQAVAEERRKAVEADAATAQHREAGARFRDGMANVEKAGAEKYADFEDKIAEAVEARGGETLPPLLSIGIAVSPAGADIAYQIASDESVAAKLESLAKTNPHAAAVEFGKLEGTYLDDDSDADLNPADPLDMARMLGRMKARLAGRKAPVERKTSKATAQDQRARGASGQFDVGDDTEDFAAFERKYTGKRG